MIARPGGWKSQRSQRPPEVITICEPAVGVRSESSEKLPPSDTAATI
ncbi:MAG: hypothetical protein LBK22_06760 [Tannerella sp.]|jgi:hypothetical protein|nr:hypothetical protein [Tannerella sp.]